MNNLQLFVLTMVTAGLIERCFHWLPWRRRPVKAERRHPQRIEGQRHPWLSYQWPPPGLSPTTEVLEPPSNVIERALGLPDAVTHEKIGAIYPSSFANLLYRSWLKEAECNQCHQTFLNPRDSVRIVCVACLDDDMPTEATPAQRDARMKYSMHHQLIISPS